MHQKIAAEREMLGAEGIEKILEAGLQWELAPTLNAGGAIVFPHAGLSACGYQIAAAVHACLECDADRVLVIGVLHALSDELQDARVRVAAGGNLIHEAYWGIQGPNLGGPDSWRHEFSLSNFLFLFEEERKRRGV